MKFLRRAVILLIVGVMLFGTMGVNAAPSTIRVAIILKTLSNPFWVSMKEGIIAEAKAKGVTADVYAVDSEADTQGQLKLFETCIAKKYQGIGFAPISKVNLIQAVAKATKKGIYLVNVDEQIDMKELRAQGGSVLAFVTTDNVKVGEKGANYIIDKLGAEGGDVAIIEGQAGATSGENRRDGAKNAFNAKANIKLVASQPADWDRIKALDVATNIMQRFPSVKAFYCCNDTMALGAIQAVKNANKLGKILVVGTDGDPEAVKSVKSSELLATVAQDPAQIGATGVDLLVDAVKKKAKISVNAEPKFIAVDSKLIVK